MAMTSFYATKCCQLVSHHEASAGSYAAAAVSSRSAVYLYLFLYSYHVFDIVCFIHACHDYRNSHIHSDGGMATVESYSGIIFERPVVFLKKM